MRTNVKLSKRSSAYTDGSGNLFNGYMGDCPERGVSAYDGRLPPLREEIEADSILTPSAAKSPARHTLAAPISPRATKISPKTQKHVGPTEDESPRSRCSSEAETDSWAMSFPAEKASCESH